MTASFIQEQIPIRMHELGFGTNYRVEMQTWGIPANTVLRKNMYNTWVYFPMEYVKNVAGLTIESDFGYLDFAGPTNEIHYEHTGKVIIDNSQNAVQVLLVVMLAIPEVSEISKPQNLSISS